MSNLKRKPQEGPDVSIYEPECAVYSPHVIEEWVDGVEFKPRDYEQYADFLLTVIPHYCCEEGGSLSGPPEFWQRNVLSYSFFLGLGVTIFKRPFAHGLLCGLVEGWSREALVWLYTVGKIDHADNAQLWNHAVNVLTFFTGEASPETTGPDADEELVKQRASIAGFTPAIRLGLNSPEMAVALFEGAVNEREKCDDAKLVGRLDWMKAYIADAFRKDQARSSN
jgi:hypothetical protein